MNIFIINKKMSDLNQFIKLLEREMHKHIDKKKFIDQIDKYIFNLVIINSGYFAFMQNIPEIKEALEKAKEPA
jgi:hypothetical protein